MSVSKTPDLTIVIVTFKSKGVVEPCLDSLAADGYLPEGPHGTVEIIVVASCSGDGTAEDTAASYPTVTVVPLDENVGFARSCNIGIRRSASPSVLLLSPDCIVQPGAIAALRAELNARPKAAAVGPSLTYASGVPQISARHFPSVKQEFVHHLAPIANWIGIEDAVAEQPKRSTAVDAISAACMLMRRDALEDFGILDESFFRYYEGADWCKRARDAGWEIRHLPNVSVVHTGGPAAAESGEDMLSGPSREIYIDSRRTYFRKHYGVHAVLAIEAIRASRRLVRSAKSALGMPLGAW